MSIVKLTCDRLWNIISCMLRPHNVHNIIAHVTFLDKVRKRREISVL